MSAWWRHGTLVLIGLVLVSLNLRPAAVSVAPVLSEVRSALSMSGAATGLLTSLPVIGFAFFGALAPAAARRIGVHRVTLAALLAVVAGLLLRALTHSEIAFLLYSLVALSGMAMANVLIPSLVKLHFPDRIGTVTAIYTTALAIGLTAALTLTVPIAQVGGGWRIGLGGWALLAAVAALPWLALISRDRRLEESPQTIRFIDVARTRVGLAMAAIFGLQSLLAYSMFGWFATLWRESGYSAATAGLLAGLLAATSIPLSSWLPRRLAASDDPRRLLLGVIACYPVGFVGLIIAPYTLAPLWAILTGAGACLFPMVLTLIGLRARTPAGTAALSGFTQSTGYLIAALGPFLVGILHETTGGWTVPLLLMLALLVPLTALALYVARPHYLEDQLAASPVGLGE